MKNHRSIVILTLVTLALTPALYAHPGHGDHGIMHYGVLKIVIGGLVLAASALVTTILVRRHIKRLAHVREAAVARNSQ